VTAAATGALPVAGPAARYRIKPLDEVFLVFDRAFDTTHFLDFFAAAILRSLIAGGDGDLRAAIAASLDLAPEDIPPARLQRALADLAAAGLIRQIPVP